MTPVLKQNSSLLVADLNFDPEKNQSSPKDADIAATDAAIRVLIIQTHEDWAIAQECWQLLCSS